MVFHIFNFLLLVSFPMYMRRCLQGAPFQILMLPLGMSSEGTWTGFLSLVCPVGGGDPLLDQVHGENEACGQLEVELEGQALGVAKCCQKSMHWLVREESIFTDAAASMAVEGSAIFHF